MRKVSGFSLLELMISVVIVGILTSIAIPTYNGFLVSSARSAAQSDLMALAAAMERHKAANFTYQGAATSGNDTGAPAIFHQHSPSSEPVASKRYDLTILTVSANGTSFSLRADPVASSSQNGDGSLYYYSDGRKAWDSNNNGSVGSNEYCWQC